MQINSRKRPFQRNANEFYNIGENEITKTYLYTDA